MAEQRTHRVRVALAAGYQGDRIRKIFLNSDIDHRHFYLEGTLNRRERSDQLNQDYLRGPVKTGRHVILNCEDRDHS